MNLMHDFTCLGIRNFILISRLSGLNRLLSTFSRHLKYNLKATISTNREKGNLTQ